MALVTCKECGRAVSSRANDCPQCSCPEPNNNSPNKTSLAAWLIGGFVIVGMMTIVNSRKWSDTESQC